MIVCNPAFSQLVHGTIAVVYYTPEKLVIAADSRGQLAGINGTVHEDDECKVGALGDKIVFVASGNVGYDKEWAGRSTSYVESFR